MPRIASLGDAAHRLTIPSHPCFAAQARRLGRRRRVRTPKDPSAKKRGPRAQQQLARGMRSLSTHLHIRIPHARSQVALDFALASPHSLHIRIALATGLGHSSIRGGGQTPLSLSHQPPPGSKRTCTCEREPCTCVDFVLYRYTCIGFARDKGTWDIHAHKGSSALSSSRLAQPRSPYGPPEPSRRYITHILWGGAKKEWPKSDEFSEN